MTTSRRTPCAGLERGLLVSTLSILAGVVLLGAASRPSAIGVDEGSAFASTAADCTRDVLERTALEVAADLSDDSDGAADGLDGVLATLPDDVDACSNQPNCLVRAVSAPRHAHAARISRRRRERRARDRRSHAVVAQLMPITSARTWERSRDTQSERLYSIDVSDAMVGRAPPQ